MTNVRDIRIRDRRNYIKKHGTIPEGMTVHHLWYSEKYDENSFVIITKEEHEKIHGHGVLASTGTVTPEKLRKYNRDYMREKMRKVRTEWTEEEHSKAVDTVKKCNSFYKEVKQFFNLTETMWRACTPETRKFMKETYKMIKQGENN